VDEALVSATKAYWRASAARLSAEGSPDENTEKGRKEISSSSSSMPDIENSSRLLEKHSCSVDKLSDAPDPEALPGHAVPSASNTVSSKRCTLKDDEPIRKSSRAQKLRKRDGSSVYEESSWKDWNEGDARVEAALKLLLQQVHERTI